MIVQFCLSLAFRLLAFIFSSFDITPPNYVSNALNQLTIAITDGITIVNFYLPEGFLTVMADFLIRFINIYLTVVIIKKIIDLLPWGSGNSNGY